MKKNHNHPLGLLGGIMKRLFLTSGLFFWSLLGTAFTLAEETKAPAPPVARDAAKPASQDGGATWGEPITIGSGIQAGGMTVDETSGDILFFDHGTIQFELVAEGESHRRRQAAGMDRRQPMNEAHRTDQGKAHACSGSVWAIRLTASTPLFRVTQKSSGWKTSENRSDS